MTAAPLRDEAVHEKRIAAAAVVDRAFDDAAAGLRRLADRLFRYCDETIDGMGMRGAGDAVIAATYLQKLAMDADEARGRLRSAAVTWGVA